MNEEDGNPPRWIGWFGVVVGFFCAFCAVAAYHLAVGDRISQTGPGGPLLIAGAATAGGYLLHFSGDKRFLAGTCLGVAVGALLFLATLCLGVFSRWHGS